MWAPRRSIVNLKVNLKVNPKVNPKVNVKRQITVDEAPDDTEQEQRMANQPDMSTIPGSFAGLQQVFQPQKAQGVNKTIQFDYTGPEAGTWNASVNNGQFSYGQGPAQNPNATVTVNSDDWLKILRGEMNAVSAFMSGKIKIQGDMGVMMQFQNWFARPS